jgi:hypothetical protein
MIVQFADWPKRLSKLFEIDFEGVARMPSPGKYRSVLKLVFVVTMAAGVWAMATSSASAAFWFPLPVQPNPGDVPLPPNQVAPNSGGGNPIGPPDVPPPDVPPNNTPEPASVVLGLVGMGTVGFVGFWRRQRRRGAV